MADNAIPSWIDALPSVADHPAATSAAGAQTQPSAGWIDSLPSIIDHPAAAAAPPLSASVTDHPTAGPSGDLLTDTGRRIGTAGTEVLGGLMGLPSATAHAIDWLGRKVGVDVNAQSALSSIPQPGGEGPINQLGQSTGAVPLFPTPEQARQGAYATTGATEYVPETAAGRVGQMALTGALSVPLGGAASLRGMAAALPGATAGGAAAGAIHEIAPDSIPAQIAAAVVGAKVGNKLANVGTSVTGLRTPVGGPLSPEVAKLAQVAQDHGIPIAPAQLSGNWLLRNMQDMGSKLPFSGADAFADAQREAWTRALSRQFGENAPRITPEVLNNAKDRIGGVFNDVAKRTTINATPEFVQNLADVETNAPLTMTPQEFKPIQNQLDNILGKVRPGDTISGDAYQSLTRKGTPLDLAINSSNPNIRFFAGKIRSALDDALQNSAVPEDVAALQQARSQWKAMKTVEPLTTRADAAGGLAPSVGEISPAALRSAVNQSYKRTAGDVLGQNAMTDLAKIGQRFLKEPKSSGTAERNMVRELMETGGAIGASAFGGEHALGISPLYSVGAPVAALAANRAAQSIMRNQMLARQQIAGSLNPNGFAFQSTIPVPALPFSWGAYGSNSIPNTP